MLSYRNEEYLHEEKYRKSLVEMSESLLQAGKKVILVLQAPLPGAHIDKYLESHLENLTSNIEGISVSRWNQIYGAKDKLVDELPGDVVVVNPADYFCTDVNCLVASNGQAWYFDDDHMSIAGATIVAEALLPILDMKRTNFAQSEKID